VWRAFHHEQRLQDPAHKNTILCDAKLKAVFGCKSIGSFAMNKHFSAHMGAGLDAGGAAAAGSGSEGDSSEDNEEAATAQPAKRRRGAAASSGGGGGRLSDALAAVVGAREMSRAQVRCARARVCVRV
jgi:chromatin remodeling complex protein RSC6